MLGRVLRTVAEGRGYTMRDAREAPAGFPTFLRQCIARGLSIESVLDVGVGNGTPWLYDAFPDTELMLFEPLGEVFQEAISAIIAQRAGARHFPVALGDAPGEATIHVAGSTPTSSSLLPTSQDLMDALDREGRDSGSKPLTVEVDVLDNYDPIVGRNVLKIDAEGFELPILTGGQQVLRKSELVILEVSLMPRYEGEAALSDILRFMESQGFALYEIIELSRRRPDAPSAFMDVAFVPERSALRVF